MDQYRQLYFYPSALSDNSLEALTTWTVLSLQQDQASRLTLLGLNRCLLRLRSVVDTIGTNPSPGTDGPNKISGLTTTPLGLPGRMASAGVVD